MLPFLSYSGRRGNFTEAAQVELGVRARALRRCVVIVAECCCLACCLQAGRADESRLSPSAAREFAVKGVIRRLEPGNGRVVIAHEAIPGFMEAMTMPFLAKPANSLDGFRAGDSIAFRLHVDEEKSWIEQVVKIPALPSEPTGTNLEPAQASSSMVAPHSSRHPLLNYAFTNELGQPVRLADFRGQVLALTFFFSRCPVPEYCPRLSKNFKEASQRLQTLPGAPTNYHFLSVTFDPEFDTPARLKAYAEGFGYDSNHWSFLTGPADKIAELARPSGMKFERNGSFFNHDLRTLIIDPDGRLRMMFPVGGNLSEAIVGEILKAAGATNLPGPSQQANAKDERKGSSR